ncbi:MAG: membrane protein insertion efficiency factor YidD [Rhodanobacter sp.]
MCSTPASLLLEYLYHLHAASRSGNVNFLTRLILWLLRLYKRWLSPLLGQRCRFHPSCSDYARIAVARFGPSRGSLLAGWRLLRCQPLCSGGEDPVPEHFHYPRCRCQEDSPDVH